MLAALLLNLGAGPPPPTAAAQFFGGAPVWWRCPEDDDEECEREAEIVRVPQAESAIAQAVEAIQHAPDPQPVLRDAAISYERVLSTVRSNLLEEIRDELRIAKTERLERERIGQMWRAEVRRRLREREEEDERMLVLTMLGD